MESKTQRNARLKAMRKKYGLGEFKSQKSHSTKRGQTHIMRRHKKRYSKRRSFSGSSFSGSLMSTIVPAMAYGAVREKLSDALSPVTAKVPMGNIADEVVLLGAAYFINKRNLMGLGKVAHAGMIIESARIGEALISGVAFNSGAVSASSEFASLG